MISAGPLPGGGESEIAAALEAAAKAGFTALLWRHDGSLFAESGPAIGQAAERARDAGLRLVLDIDPALFPADHPLVVSHPQAFRLRRNAAEHAPVDPRKPAPVSGEAWARLHEPGLARLFEEPLRAALGDLVGQGAGGFRIAAADLPEAVFAGGLAEAVLRAPPRWPASDFASANSERACSQCSRERPSGRPSLSQIS